MKSILHSPFCFILLVLTLSLPLSAHAENLRNLTQENRQLSDSSREILTALVYLPKQVFNGTLYAGAKTAGYVSDPEFIEMVEDILYLYQRKLMWFPVLGYSSGLRPEYGAGLLYRDGAFNTLTRYSMHDADHWSMDFKTSYEQYLGRMGWKATLKGMLKKHDDYRYYGIGGDPEDDARNRFTASDDEGVFTEETKHLQWETSLFHPTRDWKVEYMGFYQRRGFESSGRGNKDLRNEFDLTRIPGFINDAPVEQIYQEVNLTIDTRDHKKIISKGFRGQIYGGISNGIGRNSSDFIRGGFDAAGYIPLWRENRILAPRIVYDQAGSIDGKTIPFTEYPRHPTFRGVSSRHLLHMEKASSVLTLEYQWPISHMLTGHLFTDYLVAGSSAGSFQWKEARWAGGAGFGLHYLNKEFARLELAGGNEGFQMTFRTGLPQPSNKRGI